MIVTILCGTCRKVWILPTKVDERFETVCLDVKLPQDLTRAQNVNLMVLYVLENCRQPISLRFTTTIATPTTLSEDAPFIAKTLHLR
jgi:hypothetical protein